MRKLKEGLFDDVEFEAELSTPTMEKYKDVISMSIDEGILNRETPKETIENTIYEVLRMFPEDNINKEILRDYVCKKVYERNPYEEEADEYLKESKSLKEDRNCVVVKILDSFDTEARNVIESYGGQLDYDIWSISKENIQDVKDEIDDWKNRIAFYSSYNYISGRFGKKLKESKVILHFDLEDGTHKALPFESTRDAMEYMDSDDFPVGEWVGDYELEYVKETKPAEDDYEYKVLKPEDVEKLNDLVKEIKDGNEDGWVDWIDLAIEIGRKYLGKSLSRYGEGEYTPFEDLINECETFVYYKTPGIDRILKKRLDFQNKEESVEEK